MSFLDHLEELRWHIMRSVVAVMLFAVVAFIFNDIIFDYILLAPKNPDFITNRLFCQFGNWIGSESLCINSKPFQIINITMAGQFSTHISVSLIAGVIIAFPYIFWQFWSFLEPALYEKERNQGRKAVFASSILFLMGVAFGYYIIVPLSVHFLGGYSISAEISNQINLTSYISTINSVVIASGAIFELPVIMYFLSKIGLVTPAFLRKYRKHSVVIILIVAAVITPPDVFSQILVTIPLQILYEVSIIISARVEKKRNAENLA
ncbi:MAG TPA: twin-arginine translocase subunit TatC [Bacteroidales bacterium]|nr:twin-arginine translocase subunit TatC [Bacteroidales bacterium]